MYPGRESGTDPLGIGAKRNETKRKRTAPTSIIFRSFVVERIGCGANRSIGGQSWVAQRVNFGFCETGDLRGTKTRNTPRYNWSCWLNGSIWCKSLVCDILGWITVPSDFSIRCRRKRRALLVLFPIPNTLYVDVVLSWYAGEHLEISEWANYRTVGTEVVGRRIARFDWSSRGTREDCGSRGDCGNPRDESLSFNLRVLSFLFRERERELEFVWILYHANLLCIVKR